MIGQTGAENIALDKSGEADLETMAGMKAADLVLCVTLVAQGAAPLPAAAIAETVHKLAAIRPPDEEMSTDVPEEAQPLLSELKHELRDLIVSTINDPASPGANPTQATQSVLQKLDRVDVQVGGDLQPRYFGGILSVEIVQPPGHPGLRAVTTTVGLPCGGDTSLYVLRRQGPQWAVIIAVESNNYPDIAWAQLNLGYAVSPPDESGDWFLVAKYVGSWCVSRWHSIHCRVMRPGPSPTKPRTLLVINVDNVTDEPNTLTVQKHGFTLVNVGRQPLDEAILTRIHVNRYSVFGDRVTRVPPIAAIPQDFVAEWVELPPEEARRWSNGPAVNRIEAWHSWFRQGTAHSEFDFVQPCNQPPSKWQIGLWFHSQQPPELFFTVIKKNGAFYMTDISEKRAPGCPGEAYRYPDLPWELLKKELNHLPSPFTPQVTPHPSRSGW